MPRLWTAALWMPCGQKNSMTRLAGARILPWCLPLFLLAAWWGAAALEAVPGWLLPSPVEVARTVYVYVVGIGDGPYGGRFRHDAVASLARVGCGYALAVVPGLVLGLWSGRSVTVARLLSFTVNGVKSVPGISWLPLALIWLGVGFMTTVSLIALAGFFPVYFSAAAAAASVPQDLLNAGRMLGCSRITLFTRVILPWAMPQVCAGLRVALGMSFAYLVLGELTGVPDGLGALIMDARMNGRVDILLTGIVLIAALGSVCDALLVRVLRRLPGAAR
ncbi:MAG: Putative aliphatic sulfonates transport permease protein SsuC [Desulfovibrio sp.]